MNMKRNILLTVSAVLAAGLLSSCNREAIPAASEGNQFLMLSPALLDMQEDALTTRALSADDLKDDQFNESKVTRLDVFLFKADGTFVKDYHIDGLTPAMIVQRGGKEGYLLSNDWKKDGLDQNVAYKVYVVANSANEAIAAEGATTEAALKALTTVDAAIYKRYLAGAAADNETYSADKTFLMNATVDSWTIQNQATQLIGDETVVLQRAAVKFVMDISLSDKFKARLAADNTEYGTPSWKFVNFNTVTPEIPGTTPEAQLVTRGSGGYLLSAAGETGHFNVTTYAYPQAWTAATAKDTAPAILVSYPAVNHTTGYANNHYYYIPLCPDTVTGTQRNKLYKVNAVVSSYGSFETLTNNPVNLTYEVKDWTANEADVNAYATDYLLATPTRYAFKGGNEGEYLSKNFHYYASGTVTVEGVRAYYKNREGQETTVTGGYTVGAPANGVITVTSTVPTNGTFRTLEFTVKCADKTEKVIIRHYPADFITGISSSWSSYAASGWAEKGVSGKTYTSSYVSSGGSFRFDDDTDDRFHAHMYYNGHVYLLKKDGTRGGNDNLGDATNNQMYVLQITAASDDYRLGRPELTTQTATVYNRDGYNLGTVQYVTSDDNVLSPAFMLGSQLGVNLGFPSQATSAIHCALYKEVAEDGTVYTGWRLPTRKEVEYMIKNQNTNTQVMIEVLGGRRYWTLDGSYATYAQGDNGDGSQVWTRCVRDVTAEEIAKLNEF